MENITLKENMFNGEGRHIRIILHIQYYLVLFLRFFLIKKRKQYISATEKKTDSAFNGRLISMIMMEIT